MIEQPKLYANFHIDDLEEDKSNESELYSDWVNEINKIHGFRIMYKIMHIMGEELYDNSEDSYLEIEKEIYATGEFHNLDDNNAAASFLFGQSQIEIYIPYTEFHEAFGDIIPKDKDQIKFKWSDYWYEIIDAGRDDGEYVFNYHGYCWKIVLIPLKESSDITEEKTEIEQELGKVVIKQDLDDLFYDSE